MSGKSMMIVPGGDAVAEVNVYRKGELVIVVGTGRGQVTRDTAYGEVRVSGAGSFAVVFENQTLFAIAKAKAHDKNPALYAHCVGILNVDDDPNDAPELPDGVDIETVLREMAVSPPRALPAAASPPLLRNPLRLSSRKIA